MNMVIDFHTHPIPEAFRQALSDMNIDPIEDDGFPLPEWTVDAHLDFMAQAGIDYSVLSLPSPHFNSGDNIKAAKYARLINEELSGIVAAHKDKFGFVACLPLPDVDASIKEINYALHNLGALGVKVPTNANGVYLGNPILDPVMEELDRQKAMVIIHPNRARKAPEDVITATTAALYEYPVDTTRAVLNMAAHNIMVRYPGIRFIVPHTGSFLPYMKQRFAGISAILAAKGMMEQVNIEDNLKNLYYDIAGDPEPIQLDMLLMITDAAHLVFGTDYPHSPASVILNKKKHLEENGNYETLLPSIYEGNGRNLLGME